MEDFEEEKGLFHMLLWGLIKMKTPKGSCDWRFGYHFNKGQYIYGEVTRQRKRVELPEVGNCGKVNVWGN